MALTYTWPKRAYQGPSEALVIRLRGFKDRLLERNVSESSIFQLCGPGGRTTAAGANAAEQWLALRPRPTAVFATNDILCLGVIEVAEKHGLQTKRDYSIVGFDDINLVRWLHIPLTTVAQPMGEIAQLVVKLLREQLEERHDEQTQHILLKPKIVIRDSTARPPKSP